MRILGSAAGGGFPQWNCRCPCCDLAWRADPRVLARTQSSIAVHGLDGSWVLVNASPDIRQQIAANHAFAPRTTRGSQIAAVVLTNADVDHVAGLLSLRERALLRIYASAPVRQSLAANAIFNVLAPDVTQWTTIKPDEPFEPVEGVVMSLHAVPGKTPLWSETDEVRTDIADGRTVGVAITVADRTAHYVPGCAMVTADVMAWLENSHLLLFDGTLFSDDEMLRLGLGNKTGRRMGHAPIDGEGGSLDALMSLSVRRRVYIHINNSNPVLIGGSPERKKAEAAGWTIGEDGMEFTL
ncbi:MAG: pyrroloquinoline quinone biosynthesis protein PqqB [Bosea sp. (in: a-proteobacteria)]